MSSLRALIVTANLTASMALGLREKLIVAFTGAAIAMSLVPIAHAQDIDAQPAAAQTEVCDLSSQELCDLRDATKQAADYALGNPGVGILIHVGTQTFPLGQFETADDFGKALVMAFNNEGVEAAYFLRQNDIPGTVMSFFVGPVMHGQHNGTEVKQLNDAVAAIPEVAAQARRIHGLD